MWRGYRLRTQDAESPPLIGWRTIRHRHLGADAAHHVETEAPLFLDAAGRTLRLAPLLALRRCTVCGKQDVFFYDSRSDHEAGSGFVFIDYLTGHRMAAPRHQVPDLTAELDAGISGAADDLALPSVEGTVDEIYGDRPVEALLMEKAFVESHDRGVFWLSAPGNVGKSQFVRGVADPNAVGGRPLIEGAFVAALLLRREIRPTARDLRAVITDRVLKEGFGLSERGADFPRLDIETSDAKAASARFLH